jgi:hypothetical protein
MLERSKQKKKQKLSLASVLVRVVGVAGKLSMI